MAKILKYRIDDEIELPLNAKILSCKEQDHTLYVWVQIEEPTPTNFDKVRFLITTTGKEFKSEDWSYLTTIVDGPLGEFVWHVLVKK